MSRFSLIILIIPMIAVEFTLMIVTRTNFGFGGNNENIVLVDFEIELETV